MAIGHHAAQNWVLFSKFRLLDAFFWGPGLSLFVFWWFRGGLFEWRGLQNRDGMR